MENFDYFSETMCDDVSSTEEKYWNNLAYEQSKESSSTFDDSFQSASVNCVDPNVKDHSVEQNISKVPKRRGRREKKEINLHLPYELQQSYRILNDLMSDSNKALNWPFLDPLPPEKNVNGIIKEPMWFNKIKENLDKGEYDSITQLIRDIRILLQNCFRTYVSSHPFAKRGLKLETMLEQKLALLPRELRDKTSIAATSGIPDEDSVSPYTSRRRIRYSHSLNSSLLMNQLRQEHFEQEREHRKQQVQDRKAANEAFYQEVLQWEDEVLIKTLKSCVLDMWELPQIGLFLYLAQAALNLQEISQFELERLFILPRESVAMHSMMTSLLSTPYQRTKLDKKPDMPYKVWHEKLKNKVTYWYKILHDKGGDEYETSICLGLDVNFFSVCGQSNPLENKAFHELSIRQKVWLVKSLCDICCEKESTVQEAINAHPLLDQRAYILGCDSLDNIYLHFPQFCGADLRIYKQAHLPDPKIPKEREIKRDFPHAKKKKQPKKSLKNSQRPTRFRPKAIFGNSEELQLQEEVPKVEAEQFYLIVDSVESLRRLIGELEDRQGKKRKIKEGSSQNCEKELISIFTNILTELEPWETKLDQATRKTRLKLKKEWDEFQKNPVEEPVKEENMWDSEEEKTCNSDDINNDNEMDNSNFSHEESRSSSLKTSSFTLNKVKMTFFKDVDSKKMDIDSEPLDISLRGRIRKARKIPNNIEDTKPRKIFKPKKIDEDKANLDLNTSAGLHILSQAALSSTPSDCLEKKSLITNSDFGSYNIFKRSATKNKLQNSEKKKKLCYYNYIENTSPSKSSQSVECNPSEQMVFKSGNSTFVAKAAISNQISSTPRNQITSPQQAQVMAHFQKQGFRVEAGPDGKVLLYIAPSCQIQKHLGVKNVTPNKTVDSLKPENLSNISPIKPNTIIGNELKDNKTAKTIVKENTLSCLHPGNSLKVTKISNSLSGLQTLNANATSHSLPLLQTTIQNSFGPQTSSCIVKGTNLLSTSTVTVSKSSNLQTPTSFGSQVKENSLLTAQVYSDLAATTVPSIPNCSAIGKSVPTTHAIIFPQSQMQPIISPNVKESTLSNHSNNTLSLNSVVLNNMPENSSFNETSSGNNQLGFPNSNLSGKSNLVIKSLVDQTSNLGNLMLGSASSSFIRGADPPSLQAQSKPKYANNVTVKSLLESCSSDKQRSVNPPTQTLTLGHKEKLIESQVQNTSNAIHFSKSAISGDIGGSNTVKTNYVPTTILNLVPTSVIVSGISTPLLSTISDRSASSTLTTNTALSAPVIMSPNKLASPIATQLLKVLPPGINAQTLVIHQNPKSIISAQNLQTVSKNSNQCPVISPSHNILGQQTFLLQGQNIIGTLVQSSPQLTTPSKAHPSTQLDLTKGIYSTSTAQSAKSNRKHTSEPPPLQSILTRSTIQSKMINSGSSNVQSASSVGIASVITKPSMVNKANWQVENLQSVSSLTQTLPTESISKTQPTMFTQGSVLNLSTRPQLVQQNKTIISQPSFIANSASSSNQNVSSTIPSNIQLQIPPDPHKVFLLNFDGQPLSTEGISVGMNNIGQHIVLSGGPLNNKPPLSTNIIPSRFILTQPVLVKGQQSKISLSNGTLPGKVVNSGLIGQPPVLHLNQPPVLINNQFQVPRTPNQKSSSMEQ